MKSPREKDRALPESVDLPAALLADVDVPSKHAPASLVISEVVRETADAVSIVFEIPAARAGSFEYRPGQFLTLRVPSDRTGSVARCYSLASAPGIDELLKVTVKRTTDGYASNWLCDNAAAGMSLDVLPPSGSFTPRRFDAPFVCLAGGSGITPMLSIIKYTLRFSDNSIQLVYANRDPESVIFDGELRNLLVAQPDRFSITHWIDSTSGYITAKSLCSILTVPSDAEVFICGPTAFMDVAHAALQSIGHDRKQVHNEVFTSLAGDPFEQHPIAELTEAEKSDSAQVEVELDGTVHKLAWPRTQSLVDVMLDNGIDVPYSCLSGECGSCTCTLREGEASMEVCEILDPADVEDGYILGCQARPKSDFLRIEF